MKRILCIHLPQWPTQRLRAAKQSPSRTSGGSSIRFDPALDLAELAKLAEMCARFSPLVGWETCGQPLAAKRAIPLNRPPAGSPSPGPDTLFLDVTGIGRLFGGEEPLRRQVEQEFVRRGYQVQAAMAGTIGAAWAAARFPGQLAGEMPIAALRLPDSTLATLAHLGLETLAQLAPLPRASLTARFGELLLLRLDQLTGAAAEIILPHRPAPRYAAEQVLEYPSSQREFVLEAALALLGQLAAELAARQEGVVQFGCRLDCAAAAPLRLVIGLFRPSACGEHLGGLLRMQFDQTPLPGEVGRIRVVALLTSRLENRQGELFAGGDQAAARHWALLVDRLSSRLGAKSVLLPRLCADPLPERATKQTPATAKLIRRAAPAPGEPSAAFALQRPLTLLHPPEELAVIPSPTPPSFRWRGRLHSISRSFGPERIETGWWRGRTVRRVYYRVETAAGPRFWLFRQLEKERWYLHGIYD